MATLDIDENAIPSAKKPTKRQVAVLTCLERDKPYTRGVTWFFQSRPLDPSLGGFHFMNNGSLVITEFDPRMVSRISCYRLQIDQGLILSNSYLLLCTSDERFETVRVQSSWKKKAEYSFHGTRVTSFVCCFDETHRWQLCAPFFRWSSRMSCLM